MTRTVFLGVALAFGLATAAGAAKPTALIGKANNAGDQGCRRLRSGILARSGVAGAIRCSTAEPAHRDTTSARRQCWPN